MSHLTLSSTGFEMYLSQYRECSSGHLVSRRATCLLSEISEWRNTYCQNEISQNTILWRLFSDIINRFRSMLHNPKDIALIELDVDLTNLLYQLGIKDYSRFSKNDHRVINFLEGIYGELTLIVELMGKNADFSVQQIARFNNYSNELHAWHTRLVDCLDPEMVELEALADSLRLGSK